MTQEENWDDMLKDEFTPTPAPVGKEQAAPAVDETTPQNVTNPEEATTEQAPQSQTTETTPTQEIPPTLTEMFGERFKSAEEVKQVVTEYDNLVAMKSEIEAKSKEVVNPFADENLFKMNELIKQTGIKDYGLLAKMIGSDIDTMNSREVIKLKFMLDNPQFAKDEAYIDRKLAKTYGWDNFDELDDDDRAFQEKEIDFNAVSARKGLKEVIEKIGQYNPEQAISQSKEYYAKMEADNLNKWQPIISKTADEFSKISIPNKSGEAIMDYAVTKDFVQMCKAELIEQAKMGALTEQVKPEDLQRYIRDRFVGEHFAEIASAIYDKARSVNEAEWVKKTTNPSGERNRDIAPQPEKDNRDILTDLILS